MSDKKKRKHHYVWRKYLEAWSAGNQVWCCRDKKIYRSNLKDVGEERDFYKPKCLTKDDIQAIRKIFIEPISSDEVKQLNLGWLKLYEGISNIQRYLNKHDLNQADIRQLEVNLHNIEEDHYMRMEKAAWTYLASIIREDLSFYEREEDHINFIIFVCFQYFRTKTFYKRMRYAFNDSDDKILNVERAAAFIRFYGATNVGASIYREKGIWKLVLLRNQSDIPFITCDQPVMNTFAYGKPAMSQVEDLELYYPIAPYLAVLLTKKKCFSYTDKSDIQKIEADTYNALAVNASYEAIYGNQEQVLKDQLPFIKSNTFSAFG